MNCIDVQGLIMPFINNKLSLEELERFLDHINSCPNCMDELEVYYVLISGMKQLDEERELSTNFHKDLINLLKESEEKVLHRKMLQIRKRVTLIFLITLVAVVSSIRIGELVVEEVNKVRVSNYLVNDIFRANNSLFMPEDRTVLFPEELPEKILNNLPHIYYYLSIRDKDGAVKMYTAFGDEIFEYRWYPKAKLIP